MEASSEAGRALRFGNYHPFQCLPTRITVPEGKVFVNSVMSDVPERLREGCVWGFPHLDFWEPLWSPTLTETCWARPSDAILDVSGKMFCFGICNLV
ncbi:hypothetical protein NPIL_500361 [Nephila pilipes]|uniref:Uncharacterized protein n=1 Tax=Nephila pilipes TaxID=299642 RepID=A0A8X6PJ94_NEPPI|nr:hypothetical protein NPIL_500361 [Nephila pilipes]